MERVRRILEYPSLYLRDTKQDFEDLSATLEKHNYHPSNADAQVISNSVKELNKLPLMPFVDGSITGFIAGSFIRHRIAATMFYTYLFYQAREIYMKPVADHCLRSTMSLQTPVGAEMIEIVRNRDANHHLLSKLPARHNLPGRIATPKAVADRDWQTNSAAVNPRQEPVPGDGLRDLSDPFDLSFQQSADVSSSGSPDKEAFKQSKSQEEKQHRQELYRARREARKQHLEVDLSDDT